MNELLTYRLKKLAAQAKCPACGKQILSGGGGIAFAVSYFECGSEFTLCNGEITATKPCPGSSFVAAALLNQEAAAEAAKAGTA